MPLPAAVHGRIAPADPHPWFQQEKGIFAGALCSAFEPECVGTSINRNGPLSLREG